MTMKILDVHRETKGDQDYWMIALDIDGPDGVPQRAVQILPADSLEWRAAEYGIDPTDTATLLDILLAEPHLSAEDWAAGHQLHDAPDIATARRDHLERCAAAKWRHRISTRAQANPCRRILDESPLHPEAIELKRQLVDQARAAYASTQAAVAPPPDRIAALRAAVERGQPT